jgi:hypothetical protein
MTASPVANPTGVHNGPLPLIVGFRDDILPALLVLWAIVVAEFVAWRQDFWFTVGVWASVTTIMLWPVGRRLGRPYLSYRRPLFILGVLSMAGLPILGFALQLLPPTRPDAPYLSRTWMLLAVVADLTLFSIIAATRSAIGRPIRMFFRPDLLFGDGRLLATGIIALGLSMRFLFGGLPPDAPYIPTPRGSWWGLFFAIVFGVIQIIPLRGMFKMRQRLARMLGNQRSGWIAVILREGWLILATLAIYYGFHNAFHGSVPVFQPSLSGLEPDRFASSGLPGLISLVLAALFIVFVRGGYKKAIGDPFIKETLRQSIIKQALFLVGFVWLTYSFASIMTGRPFGSAPNTQASPALIGWALFIWSGLLLGPIRIWAQRNQRLAIAQQMVTVLLPAQPLERRKEVMLKVMHALAACPVNQRAALMRAMQEALNDAPDDVRQAMTQLRMECLTELPADKRRVLLTTMDTLMSST